MERKKEETAQDNIKTENQSELTKSGVDVAQLNSTVHRCSQE